MKTKHTPGPWEALIDRKPRRHEKRQATTLVSTNAVSNDDVRIVLAIDCTSSGQDYDEDCANARLVAAAPDMLDALEDAEHWLGQAWACIEHIKESAPEYERKAAFDLLKEISRAAHAARIIIGNARGVSDEQ